MSQVLSKIYPILMSNRYYALLILAIILDLLTQAIFSTSLTLFTGLVLLSIYSVALVKIEQSKLNIITFYWIYWLIGILVHVFFPDDFIINFIALGGMMCVALYMHIQLWKLLNDKCEAQIEVLSLTFFGLALVLPTYRKMIDAYCDLENASEQKD